MGASLTVDIDWTRKPHALGPPGGQATDTPAGGSPLTWAGPETPAAITTNSGGGRRLYRPVIAGAVVAVVVIIVVTVVVVLSAGGTKPAATTSPNLTAQTTTPMVSPGNGSGGGALGGSLQGTVPTAPSPGGSGSVTIPYNGLTFGTFAESQKICTQGGLLHLQITILGITPGTPVVLKLNGRGVPPSLTYSADPGVPFQRDFPIAPFRGVEQWGEAIVSIGGQPPPVAGQDDAVAPWAC